MADNFFEDKTYIFRAFFGFDVYSMIHHLSKILKTENIHLYTYNNEHLRVSDHLNAWIAFYDKWLSNFETVENTILKFVDNPHLHLKDIYDSANDVLQEHIDKCIALNTKEHIMEEIQMSKFVSAFKDCDEDLIDK